jgi:hypothetical protein
MTVLTTVKPGEKRRFRRRSIQPTAPPLPARPVAHPFAHAEPSVPARCPACELREYLEA